MSEPEAEPDPVDALWKPSYSTKSRFKESIELVFVHQINGPVDLFHAGGWVKVLSKSTIGFEAVVHYLTKYGARGTNYIPMYEVFDLFDTVYIRRVKNVAIAA